MTGYVLAVVSSVFFSLYVIPRKLSKQNPLYFSLFVGLGFFISSFILYFLKPLLKFHETLSATLLWSVAAGIIWAISFVCLVKAIDSIGLARSNQWKNLQGPAGIILSLTILSEYTKTNWIFVVLAGLAIFLSAMFFTVSNTKEEARTNRRGVYLALLSGLLFGMVTVINKYVTDHVGVYYQQIVWSFSIFLSLLFYILIKKQFVQIRKINRSDIILGLSGGVLYLGASFFMLQSYKHLPASIGFTIIQLNAIWTVALGILVFKEINAKKFAARIALGFLFATAGIVLLAFAHK